MTKQQGDKEKRKWIERTHVMPVDMQKNTKLFWTHFPHTIGNEKHSGVAVPVPSEYWDKYIEICNLRFVELMKKHGIKVD